MTSPAKRVQVKTFSARYLPELEALVNDWLGANQVEVIGVSHAIGIVEGFLGMNTPTQEYSCVLTYSA